MELIYTDSDLKEIFVITNAEYEASVGKDNLFTLKVPKALYADIKDGFILCDGDNEAAGGRVTTVLVDSDDEIITFEGKTWLGLLRDLTIVANKTFAGVTVSEVINTLLSEAKLYDFFEMLPTSETVDSLYVGYGTAFADLIDSLIKDRSLVIDFSYNSEKRKINILTRAVTAVTDDTISSDHFHIKLTKCLRPYTEATAISEEGFTATAFLQYDGTIGNKQYYKGIDRRVYVYSADPPLYAESVEKLRELQNTDSAVIEVTDDVIASVGDTIGAVEEITGVYVEATVTEKIVKNSRGFETTDYITESEGN